MGGRRAGASASPDRRLRVVVVGQTPPPFHGQALAVEMLLEGSYRRMALSHVPMSFSRRIEEVGRFRIGKVLMLPVLIVRVLWRRLTTGARVLYYPPYAAERVPLMRDLAVLVACRWAFRWTVFHLHATGMADAYRTLGPVRRLAFRLAYFDPDVVITPSQASGDDGRFLRGRRLAVVPNGVPDPGVSTPAAGAEGTPVMLYTGVVRATKGVLVLLDACAMLRDDGVGFRLELMGELQPAGFAAELAARVDELRLSDRVVLLGRRTGTEKSDVLRGADVFCFPSLFDNFPLAVLEAMSFALPVVASRCGGLGEIVSEGRSGYLVEVGDSRALADRLGRLLQDPELRRSMGRAGRGRYQACFTVERYRQGVEDAVCLVREAPAVSAPAGSAAAGAG